MFKAKSLKWDGSKLIEKLTSLDVRYSRIIGNAIIMFRLLQS